MRPCLKIIKRKNTIKNSYSSINIPDSFPPKDVIWFLDRDSFFGCPETHSGPISQKLRSTDWATIIPDSYLMKFSFLLPLFVCVPVCLLVRWGVLHHTEWSWTCYSSEDDHELLILLPLVPECRDHRCDCMHTYSMYAGLGIKLRNWCMLGKYSKNCVTSIAHYPLTQIRNLTLDDWWH